RIAGQPGLAICGEAATEEEALALARQNAPDLAVVDISLKSGHGIDVVKQIRTRHPHVKVLVLSAFQESLYAERALRAGAHGYRNKQESNEKVLGAIHALLDGRLYASPAITQRLVGQALGKLETVRTPIEQLSDRELEVFRMIGEGLASGAIATK